MRKFYFFILLILFFSLNCFAQTAISSFIGGGFDQGNTFAENGWTVVNSPGANKWVVGPTTYFSEPNSAYISIDGNPANYSYDNKTAHVSHFYQEVTIPANAFNVVLQFQFKGNVDFDEENFVMHDGLQIFADPSLTVPVADALPGGTADIVYVQLDQSETYVVQNITLDKYAGKTFLLIFTWVNDGNGIGVSGLPASVDGVSVEYCVKSADYNVTGGGAFCTGSSGVGVGLAGSDIGIHYQLYNNGIPVGDPVDGTGSAIDFGPQKVVGTYKVDGSSSCNFGNYTFPMTGSVIVTENPLPVATAGSNGPICFGSTLDLTSSGGASYAWTGPNGFMSTDQNPSISNFTTDDAGIYTVIVTTNGCSSPANTNVTITEGNVSGGKVSSESICRGGGGSLTLSGNSSNPARWEYTIDSASSSWTNISNKTTSLIFSEITVPTYYRAVVNDGCGQAFSDTATVSIRNYWTGTTSSDWNITGNWSDGLLPSATFCPDVYIPGGMPNEPILSGTPIASITNLHIITGASLTVNNTGLIQVGGTISNAGILDVSAGSIEFNGTAIQNIHGGLFQTNTIKNLIVSNASGLTVANTPGDTLKISGTLSFGSTGQLNTGDRITLLSGASGTANVGVMGNNNSINGKVTVERFINTGDEGHPKSWQLLAVPTQGQTIRESWMEGATATNIGSIPRSAGNPHPGYGTMTTSNVTNANTFLSPGFDAYTSPGPSIKVYNSVTNVYEGPSNTNIPVYNKKGYMILVRGDRSVSTSSSLENPTILRTTGTLFTPAAPAPLTDIPKGKFESVGNPYASSIDLRHVTRGGGTQNFYYVWDPKLSGAYSLGAFQTLAPGEGGNYYATPGGGSYPGINNTIQSGQAFLVAADAGSDGTLSFKESSKIDGSSLVLRGSPAGGIGEVAQIRASLYGMADTTFLSDGNLVQFNAAYSNKIDVMDARKLMNSSENFGILSGGKSLVIERRHHLVQTDTIFYNLTGLRVQKYLVRFITDGMSASALQGFVEDMYQNTRIPLNMEGITEINFLVTNAANSYASNRFRIVFSLKPSVEAEDPIIYLKSQQQDSDIGVEWKMKNEKGVQYYEVESSVNGVNFTRSAIVQAFSIRLGNYQWTDKEVTNGDHYYRIKCIRGNGREVYSNTVKETVVLGDASIRIHPNPIVNGKIHLQFSNQPKGKYRLRLLNPSGQLMMSRQIELPGGGITTELIQWNYHLAHGVYQLEITRPDGSVKVINVLY